MHSCKYREIACYAGEMGRLPGRTVMLPTGKKQCICKVIVDSLYISTPPLPLLLTTIPHPEFLSSLLQILFSIPIPQPLPRILDNILSTWRSYTGISRILSRMLMFSQPRTVFQSNLGTPRIPFQTPLF